MSRFKGNAARFLLKIQEYVGCRGCGTGGAKQRVERKKKQKREVYVIKLSAYLLFVLPGIISGVSI